MTCQILHNKLDDYLDGSLEPAVHAALGHHLESCSECRNVLLREQQFRALLRKQPVAPASPGFSARALRQAARRQSQRRGFAAGFATAAAAALVLWLGTTLWQPASLPEAQLPGINLVLNQSQKVNLVVNAPRAMERATLAIYLPEHAELDGYPGQRELIWQTSLQQGQNLLALPLIARHKEGGELIAKVAYDGQEKTIRLRLKVEPQHHSQIRIDVA